MKYKKVCSVCGSEDILFDSFATWNIEDQMFELHEVYDDGHFCNECVQNCKIEDKIIED